MNIRLTPLQSRFAASVLLAVTVALVVALFVAPTLWLHKHYDAFLDDYADRLERYRRVAALRPTIEAATDEVLKRDGRKFYLHANSLTLAAAELQGLLTRLVEGNKGHITSSQVLAQKDEPQADEPRKVTLYIQLTASIVPLQLILHAIESNVPYLYIDRVVLASNHGRAYRPEPGVQPEFGVQLTVSGYALPEKAIP